MALVGREAALRAVGTLLEEGGGALLVHGERGSGRTSVLEHAHARAAALGFAVVRELPDVDGDPFQAGLATLRVLLQAAERRPVAVLLDDVEAVDRLAFVGRRLADAPVVIVAVGGPAELPTVSLGPLAETDARALLPPELPDRLATAVLAAADGLALALVELGASALAAADVLLAQPEIRLPVSARLADVLRARLAGLDARCRAVLLAAALDPEANVDEALAAAGASRLDLATALDAGAVTVHDGAVHLTSPLTALAARAVASPGEVEAMHAALASAVEDPHRRMLHRAARLGTRVAWRGHGAGPWPGGPVDERLALALCAAARDGRRRGRPAVAAAAYESAARVGAPGMAVERLLGASSAGLELGCPELARRLLDEAGRREPPAGLAPVIEWQRRRLAGEWPVPDEAESVRLVDALADGPDAEAALSALLPLAEGCWWEDTSPRVRATIERAAARLTRRTADPRADAIRALVDPESAAPALLARIGVSGPAGPPTTTPQPATSTPSAVPVAAELADPLDAVHLATAAQAVGAWRASLRLVGPAVHRLRGHGHPGALAHALVHQGLAAHYTGDWTLAVELGREARALAERVGLPRLALAGLLTHARALAMIQDAGAVLAEAAERAAHSGLAGADAVVRSARGGVALAAGDPEAAVAQLAPALTGTPPAMVRAGWEILDLTDALVALNRQEEAAARLADFEPHALRPPRGLADVALMSARAIVTDRYDEALTADLTAWPFVRARTLLAFGGSLRRAKRAGEAADALRAARDELTLLGAAPFVARAQRELRAAGEAGPAPTAGLADLTPHELRIAQLAASGLSNPEIARRLEVSPRTIGSHLYRIFPKLGITSRAQLATALEQR